MVRRTAEEAERTRATILDAALEVFAERGVHAAQLEEIARRAGVTRGALYHHFDDKTELLLAVLKERWTTSMAPVLEPLRGGGGAESIRQFARRFLECADSNPTVRALLKLSLSGELSALEGAGMADKSRAWGEWLALLDKNISCVTSRRDVRTASEGVLHALLGYALWSSLFGPPRTRSYDIRCTQILKGISS